MRISSLQQVGTRVGRVVLGIAFLGSTLAACDEASAIVKGLLARGSRASDGGVMIETDAASAPGGTAEGARAGGTRERRRHRISDDSDEQPRAEPALEGTPSDDPGADRDFAFDSGDTTYEEADCATLADLPELASAGGNGSIRASAEAIARARYPMGLPFLRAQDDTQLAAWFTGGPAAFAGVGARFDTAVHEGSHIWRVKHWSARTESFPVWGDRSVEARMLATFHRNEILDVHVDVKSDRYTKPYLEGASGAQGFATLLDEYQAYAHSLASRYCTRDLVPAGMQVSARDGILTMMYYVETYLALARERHPNVYVAILGDPGYRKVILAVWDRAELWLRRSRGERALGVSDRRVAAWVYEPSRLAEITRVREREAGSARSDAGKAR